MKKIKAVFAALTICCMSAFIFTVVSAAGNFGLENATILEKAENVIAETPTISGNTVNTKIVFHKLNDYVTYNLSLRNSTTTSLKIIDISDNNTSALVDYSYENHADEVIQASEALNLEVKITYKQAHEDDTDRTIDNSVKFTISYLDLQTNQVEEDEVALVPNTGANFFKSEFSGQTSSLSAIIAIIIAGIVLVIAFIFRKKRIVATFVFAIIFTATGFYCMGAVAEDYTDTDVSLNSNIKLRDYFFGEVYWKDPDTGEDAHVTPEEFGTISYEDGYTFGDIFDPEWVPVPSGLMVSGFKFTGTDTEIDPEALILDDFSVTVLYEEARYRITYDYAGGTVATANPTTIKGTDAPFTLNKPSKDSAVFACWHGTGMPEYECEENVTIDPSTVDRNLSYKAIYSHEVTINDQFGNQLGHDFVPEGEGNNTFSAVFENVQGYIVNSGTCTNNQRLRIYSSKTTYEVDAVTYNTVCTLDVTYQTYNVTLVVNNGTGSSEQNVNYDQNAVFNNVAPNEYYTLGELTCTNGQTASYENNTITVNNVKNDTTCTVTALLYMQDTTSTVLDGLIPNNGDTITAYDKRDGESYLIGRIADGNVWTLENLRIDMVATPLDKLVGNTNASETTLAKFKNGGGTDTDRYPTSGAEYFSNKESYTTPMIYVEDKDTVIEAGYPGKIGALYNYCAASAGSYCFKGGRSDSEPINQLPEDICPKGWHMPTGDKYSGGEFATMGQAYSERKQDIINALHLTFAGRVTDTGVDSRGDAIYLFSSNSGNRWNSIYLYIGSSQMTYAYLDNVMGKTVRCVAD